MTERGCWESSTGQEDGRPRGKLILNAVREADAGSRDGGSWSRAPGRNSRPGAQGLKPRSRLFFVSVCLGSS